MTCPGCGAYVPDGSRFCNACGASTAAAVAVASADVPEHVVFTLRPAFLFVGAKYAVAAVLWLCATAIVAAVASMTSVSAGVGALVVFVLGVLLFVKPAFAHLKRQRNLYTLTSHKLEIQQGVLATTVRNVPLSKIQDVTVTTTLVGRLLGLGDIRIDNASENLGQITIKGVRDPKRYADMLLSELRRWN
jgi:membrane protein YdbS with pleckstrin-like domain